MAGARQEVNGIFVYHRIEWRFAFESREEFFHGARIEERAGETVLSGFARLFDHVDILFAERGFGMARVVIVDQLRKAQRAGHARGPTADDDDVGRHFGMLDVGKRLAEDQRHGLMGEKATQIKVSGLGPRESEWRYRKECPPSAGFPPGVRECARPSHASVRRVSP